MGPTARVTGSVEYNGKPLRVGRVVFISAESDKRRGFGEIQEDGTYVVEAAPQGPTKVVLDVPDKESALSLPPEKQKLLVTIPPRYASPEKSKLTYNVPADGGTFAIKLED